MRVSTFSIFSRVLLGIQRNQLTSLRAQEELSSGRRLLRPSDDPAGTARALALQRGLASSQRVQDAVGAGKNQLDLASSTLQHGSELLTRSRELVIQAMNGSLSAEDRDTIAAELTEIRKQLLDDANLQFDGSFVFGGTRLGDKPWVEVDTGGGPRVVYRGNDSEHTIQAGADDSVAITAAGDRIFGRAVPGATRFDGLTGLRAGTTADEGSGYASIVVRHDGTDAGTLAATTGITLVDGGDRDTMLGANELTLDASAGTLRLGGGPPIAIPAAGSRADVVVRNEQGGELHLDLDAWNGSGFSGTITGSGSISMDGDTFAALDFADTDLELSRPDLGQVVHVDTRAVLRAGSELATFGDTANPFDVIQGVIDDLHNAQGLSPSEIQARLSDRLGDLDRVHDDLLLGLGVLGARSARLANANTRQGEIELELSGRLADIQDVDVSVAASDLARSQLVLQVAEAAGARVLQTSMLNFLR